MQANYSPIWDISDITGAEAADERGWRQKNGINCMQSSQGQASSLPHEKGQVTKVCGARWRHAESWFKGDNLTQCPAHDPVRLKQKLRTQKESLWWLEDKSSLDFYGGSFNKLQIHVTFPICATECSVSKSWTHTYKHISEKKSNP